MNALFLQLKPSYGLAALAAIWVYFLLHLLPIAVIVNYHGQYAYWLLSGFALPVCMLHLWRKESLVPRASALLINSAAVFVNCLFMASLYVQGQGFNEAFFYHFDLETIAVAASAYPTPFYGGLAYYLIATGWLALCFRGRTTWLLGSKTIAAFAILALVCHAPLISLCEFAERNYIAAQDNTLILKQKPRHDELIQAPADRKNLVLIFAEGLEASYNRPDLWGQDMTASLSELEKQGTRFTDMRQVSRHAESTIGGLVAAQCGVSFTTPNIWENHNFLWGTIITSPVPNLDCLGDLLSRQGYKTVYMGGADLGFAGKGIFLSSHGFDEIYGKEELSPALKDRTYLSGWGLYDDSLFDLAHKKMDRLVSEDAPFALVLLTLDTHHPSGHPSASCGPVPDRQAMAFAVNCADRLISAFVKRVAADHPNTVVALFSDHLALPNEIFDNANVPVEERRLRFTIWARHIKQQAVNKPGTHYDVAPTLLDALGFEQYAYHNLGASLLRFNSPWFALEAPESTTVTHEFMNLQLLPEQDIVFGVRGPTIRLGGHRLLATNKGRPLTDAVFAVTLDKDGRIEALLHHDEIVGRLLRREPGLIIGVSTYVAFNRFLLQGKPAKTIYFAGDPDSGQFVIGPLWWEETVKAALILE